MTEENFQPKIHQLTDKKDVVILNSDDQNPDLERLKGFNQDLENPDLADKSRIEYPDLSAVKETLAKTGYELLGDRQIASGAIFGKLFKLRVKDLKTGEEKDVLERVFSRNKGIDNRFLEYKADPGLIIEENPRYQTVDREKQEPINIIVDRLYNEEMALSDLQNIPGIPKFYASVDDGKCGSVFQEFIDGYDLSLAIDDKNITEASTVIDIFEKIKKTGHEAYLHILDQFEKFKQWYRD